MRVCLNGNIFDETEARIAPNDRGLLLGDGVFETLAVRRGEIKRWQAHADRLAHDAKVIGLRTPWAASKIKSWIDKVLSENALTDAVVRITITRGPGPRGLISPDPPQPTLLITAAPMPEPALPARVIVAKTTRRNEFSPLSAIKSTNYLDSVLARHEAAALNADDAILLNTRGLVAEATAANVFVLVDGLVATPPVADGALPGVMRADVIALARGVEANLTPETLMAASEVFLSSSLGLRAVVSIDGAPVGDGEPGLITQLLAARL